MYAELRHHQLGFEMEDALRQRGLSKTPDALLIVPFGVYVNGGSGFRVVNWIDSKAMFGDRESHVEDNLLQLQGYVNRFGPGMVIYWFGYIKSLNTDPDILMMDRFPEQICKMEQVLPVAPLADSAVLWRSSLVDPNVQPSPASQTYFDENNVPTCELVNDRQCSTATRQTKF